MLLQPDENNFSRQVSHNIQGASAARDCAARAALDLTGAEDALATLARNHRITHRDVTGLYWQHFPDR
ncbi:hypothetical protein A3K88_14345 [Pseudomonas putida]|nr:hypothetical protein A3K88_14345 [Pseudomonas putida]